MTQIDGIGPPVPCSRLLAAVVTIVIPVNVVVVVVAVGEETTGIKFSVPGSYSENITPRITLF